MFVRSDSVHSYSTRHSQSEGLSTLHMKLVTGQRTFKYRGAAKWNELDENIREISSKESFKAHLSNHLFREQIS